MFLDVIQFRIRLLGGTDAMFIQWRSGQQPAFSLNLTAAQPGLYPLLAP